MTRVKHEIKTIEAGNRFGQPAEAIGLKCRPEGEKRTPLYTCFQVLQALTGKPLVALKDAYRDVRDPARRRSGKRAAVRYVHEEDMAVVMAGLGFEMTPLETSGKLTYAQFLKQNAALCRETVVLQMTGSWGVISAHSYAGRGSQGDIVALDEMTAPRTRIINAFLVKCAPFHGAKPVLRDRWEKVAQELGQMFSFA